MNTSRNQTKSLFHRHPEFFVLLLVAILAAVSSSALAAPIIDLHDFGPGDGQSPKAGVTAVGSTLYGTTSTGGPLPNGGHGTVYSLDQTGSNFQVLSTFTDFLGGSTPAAQLTIDGSKIYGTTSTGGGDGYGEVFSENLDGTDFQILHSFTYAEGTTPKGQLLQIGSTLFGITSAGGDANGDGTIFSINENGSNFQVLHNFSFADGVKPQAGLVQIGSQVFGTTSAAGGDGYGTIFSMDTNGTNYQVLHALNFLDGINPTAPLLAIGSTLYGTAAAGGSNLAGTIFALNSDGSNFHVLQAPTFFGVGNPSSGLVTDGTRLFGIGGGVIYALDPNGANFHAITNPITGGAVGNLAIVGETLYGVNATGGAHNAGYVFATAVPEPSTIALAVSGGLLLALGYLRKRRAS